MRCAAAFLKETAEQGCGMFCLTQGVCARGRLGAGLQKGLTKPGLWFVVLISWGAEFAQPLLVSGYFFAGRLFCHLSLDIPWSQETNMCFPRVPLGRPAKASFALLNARFSTSCARVFLSQCGWSITGGCPSGHPFLQPEHVQVGFWILQAVSG